MKRFLKIKACINAMLFSWGERVKPSLIFIPYELQESNLFKYYNHRNGKSMQHVCNVHSNHLDTA
jgi:hypothetical protein